MISLLFLLAFGLLIAYVVLRKRIVLAAGFFLLFPAICRTVGIVYLDIFGPIFASELGRYVGGNAAAPMFIYAVGCLVLALLWIFRERTGPLARLPNRAPLQLYHAAVSNVALVI